MKRRGSAYWTSSRAKMIDQFSIDDIVGLFSIPSDVFYGIVKDINKVENKVYVAWNNGNVKQHDPDDVHLVLNVNEEIRKRFRTMKEASNIKGRRMAGKIKEVDAMFVGNPKTHGIDKPRGGGFSIMKDLAYELHDESYQNVKNARSRRALYFKERGRTYRKTRSENENGMVRCPKCKGEDGMDLQPFTKSIKIYICPSCGWKITTDKVAN